MGNFKLWYGWYSKPYEGNEPAFFNAHEIDWAKFLESNFQIIKEELSEILQDENDAVLKPYFESAMQSKAQSWRTQSFCSWGTKYFPLCNTFPKTNKILSQIPGLVSASINLLEPGSKILPHFGDTNGIYRCHLGLKIPEGLPACGFKVKDEIREWKEGEVLIFLDAHTHEAFNLSDKKRYILLFDVIRPEFKNKSYIICNTVLSMLTVYWLFARFPALLKFLSASSGFVRKIIIVPFQIAWIFYLPIGNLIRKVLLTTKAG